MNKEDLLILLESLKLSKTEYYILKCKNETPTKIS